MCCEYKFKVICRLSFLLILVSLVAGVVLAAIFQSEYRTAEPVYTTDTDPYKCTQVDEGKGPRGKHTCDRSDQCRGPRTCSEFGWCHCLMYDDCSYCRKKEVPQDEYATQWLQGVSDALMNENMITGISLIPAD